MTPTAPAVRLARNNAAWCDAVCRAHGAGGEHLPTLWVHRGPVPAFYPNVVTTQPGRASDALAEVGALALPGRWGVKDSFAELALAPLGFGVLFDAAWLWRAAPGGAAEGSGRVRDADTLARWEAAWGGGGMPRHETFPPALLEDPAVAMLAAQEGGRGGVRGGRSGGAHQRIPGAGRAAAAASLRAGGSREGLPRAAAGRLRTRRGARRVGGAGLHAGGAAARVAEGGSTRPPHSWRPARHSGKMSMMPLFAGTLPNLSRVDDIGTGVPSPESDSQRNIVPNSERRPRR